MLVGCVQPAQFASMLPVSLCSQLTNPSYGALHPLQARRSTRTTSAFDLDRMTEYELWKHLNDVLTACAHKAGTSECLLPAVLRGAVGLLCPKCAHRSAPTVWARMRWQQ